MPERYRIKPRSKVRLDDWDPDDTSLIKDKEDALAESETLRGRLAELQELMYAEHRHKMLVVLQGMDTSGKDGTIAHVMSGINPQGVRVATFKKPTAEQLDHDFLWRVHQQAPGNGEIAIFNRSHYEDVLVVRVHELVPRKVWNARYRQIVEFERTLAESGTVILKFFLHISKREQKRRLQARLDDPKKRWKFQHGDLEERLLWDEYRRAYEAALQKTSTHFAPWYVIPANTKWYRNYVIGRIVVRELDKLGMKYPEVDVKGIRVE